LNVGVMDLKFSRHHLCIIDFKKLVLFLYCGIIYS